MRKRKSFQVLLFTKLILIFSMTVNGQIDKNYRDIEKKAFEASSIEEYRSSLKFCTDILSITPNHPRMNYLAARLNEQLGDSKAALFYLKKAAKLGYTSNIRWFEINPMNDPVFSNLREKQAFQEVVAIMEKVDEPIHKSQIAFIINDKSFRTEGITYDPVEGLFYLGGAHKIIKVDHSGNMIDFTNESNLEGLGWVNGVHVDAEQRNLWICSNSMDKAEVFKYDLSTKNLIKKYTLRFNENNYMFNDLVIHPNGDIYVTETNNGDIYYISHLSDSLQLFLNKKFIISLNGITLSDDKRTLFAADDNIGIYKIDIKTKSCVLLAHQGDFHTYGIDGLYCANNTLYVIQNMLIPQVSKILLNKDATHITDCKILEKNTNDLPSPTTGVIINGYFYFIADSGGKGSKKDEVVVMKVPTEKTK